MYYIFPIFSEAFSMQIKENMLENIGNIGIL